MLGVAVGSESTMRIHIVEIPLLAAVVSVMLLLSVLKHPEKYIYKSVNK